jgi:hypothetical protein
VDGPRSFCDCDVEGSHVIREWVLPERPEHTAGVETLSSYSSRAAEGNVFVAAREPAITIARIPGVVGTRNEAFDIVHFYSLPIALGRERSGLPQADYAADSPSEL